MSILLRLLLLKFTGGFLNAERFTLQSRGWNYVLRKVLGYHQLNNINMEFNILVKNNVFPILKGYGFRISQESENILELESHEIKMNIIYNKYERSFFVEIGKKDNNFYPLSNNAINSILGFSLPIQNVPLTIFIKNLSIFIKEKKGLKILSGDISPLKNFVEKDSLDYTNNLIKEPTLLKVDRAWNNKDYHLFIQYFNELDISKIPQSYLLKYNIAKKKVMKS